MQFMHNYSDHCHYCS